MRARTVGSLITQHFTWHRFFYLNVRIGIVAPLAAAIPIERPHRGRARFNRASAALLAVGLATLMLGRLCGRG